VAGLAIGKGLSHMYPKLCISGFYRPFWQSVVNRK
jgi:hypothetical protein